MFRPRCDRSPVRPTGFPFGPLPECDPDRRGGPQNQGPLRPRPARPPPYLPNTRSTFSKLPPSICVTERNMIEDPLDLLTRISLKFTRSPASVLTVTRDPRHRNKASPSIWQTCA